MNSEHRSPIEATTILTRGDLFKEDLLAGLLGQGIEPQHLLLLRHARHLACGSLHAPVSNWVLQTFLSVSRGVNEALLFKSVVSRGGHSTIRIFFNEDSKIPEIRASLKNLGCSSEGTNIKRLVAVDVPPDVDMRRVEGYLNELKDNDLIDVEHGLIQHSN